MHSQSIARIKADVNDPLPYFLLGNIASEHGNHNKAVELFQKAAAFDQKEIWYQLYYARELSTLGRSNDAKPNADIARELDFTDPYIADTLGVIYSRAEYHELAIPLFEQAVSSNSSQPSYYYNLGASAQFIGDFEKAETAYKKAIELEPKLYRAWSSLISLEKQTKENNKLEALMALFEGTKSDPEGQLQLGHAIAKTLEDLGRHEESLGWLLSGKKAKREQLRYNRQTGHAMFEAAKTTNVPALINKQDHPKDAPIFIVGLPRTGTTLVDRILSSHADVVSAGELNIFAELVKDKTKTQSHLVMDAETFLETDQLDLSDIGNDYIAKTLDRARGAKHMVDKMPLNFFYAGLIHRALPNARIIALRRGAMDSCLSNFRQLFTTQYSYYNYTYDLEDTADFYRGFDGLMSHWRETLPTNRFMEVRYEKIVFDQEKQTRRLLDFCDLDWDEACMRFHENAAPVSTASSVQVRQPLYSGSIGRWKKYGSKLEILQSALGDLAD